MSLRRILAVTVVLLTGLTLAVALSLARLTSYLHGAATSLGDSAQSVRLAEEAEIALLLHRHTSDELAGSDLDANLRRDLASAHHYVSSPVEARVLDTVERAVNAYLAAHKAHAPEPLVESRLGQAYTALEALVTVNLEQARVAQLQAATWDIAGQWIAVGSSLFLLLSLAAVGWWLRGVALSPLLSLAAAMDAFGAGDRRARADETGPRELRHMARRFNEMAARIGQRRDEQLAVLGSVAHDLRNPLSALKSATAALGDGLDLGADTLKQILALVSRQVTRMDRMLGDLTDGARIEAGSLELHPERRDLRGLIREAADLYTGVSSGRRIELRLPQREVPASCDGGRIVQVLNNLISNALKYSSSGTSVSVTLTTSDADAAIEVTDCGVGIEPADLPRIFEPFRRLPQAHNISGAGLGLFVARRIVEAHGGHIAVESTVGLGSTFRIRLPLAGPHEDVGRQELTIN